MAKKPSKPHSTRDRSDVAEPTLGKTDASKAKEDEGKASGTEASRPIPPLGVTLKADAPTRPSVGSEAAAENPKDEASKENLANPSAGKVETPKPEAAKPESSEQAQKPPGKEAKRPAPSEAGTQPPAAKAGTPEPKGAEPKPAEADLLKIEAQFVASHAPLPTVDREVEAVKREHLHEVEVQFPPVEPGEATEAPSAWDSMPMSEAESEPYVESPSQPAAPAQPSLYIVQLTPELAPVAKVGGLADVVFGLSNELEIRGNHVEIILPKYDCLRYDHIWGLCETYSDLWVPWYGGAIHCTVYFGFVHGRKCFFIEPHSADNFFNRGCIYGFNDDVMRFAFFTKAALEFMWKSGKHPDIIHCHDWQTALAPVLLFEIYQHLGMRHPRVCFTIHNFKHQGVTGAPVLQATGLNRPEYFFHYDRMRDNYNPHALNLMKAGVVYSNFVTTVSPRHAMEAKDQGQGFGLEPTLHIHHMKYGGVVNGIDYSFWNPEIDHWIPVHYSADQIEGKYANKRALRDRLLIADNEKPIVAFVGRLDPQKGLELIRHALFYTLQRGGQFVLLGSSPDGQINNYFWGLKHQFNDNPDCHIEIGFNEELSHLIYAGADMVVVPSRFEPCGLTQLIAMRYGTIPIVREIGGLADTVFDKDFSNRPLHERNGYVFRDYDEAGLESALGRAISCYYEYPEHFRALMINAMRCDYSWNHPGQDYLNIYHYIRDK